MNLLTTKELISDFFFQNEFLLAHQSIDRQSNVISNITKCSSNFLKLISDKFKSHESEQVISESPKLPVDINNESDLENWKLKQNLRALNYIQGMENQWREIELSNDDIVNFESLKHDTQLRTLSMFEMV